MAQADAATQFFSRLLGAAGCGGVHRVASRSQTQRGVCLFLFCFHTVFFIEHGSLGCFQKFYPGACGVSLLGRSVEAGAEHRVVLDLRG